MSSGLSLNLEKATNARDLGGYRTTDGRTVRSGVLYRANALNRLSEADIASVGALGLACVIDFRHEREIEFVGPDRLPTPAPRTHPLPLFDPDHDVFTAVNAVLRGQAGEDALAHLREDALTGGAAVMMVELYRGFVRSEGIRPVFATAMRLVADPTQLPLLFHCTAGKDRTGWLAALVLTALGVDRETVVRDYLRTTELNALSRDYLVTSLSSLVTDSAVILPLLEAREEYLLAGFSEADQRYGGMDGYLREGLGLDDDVFAALRTNLLG